MLHRRGLGAGAGVGGASGKEVRPKLYRAERGVSITRWNLLPSDAGTAKAGAALLDTSKLRQQLVREIQVAYFFCRILSASFSAVTSASATFTFTFGSTPVPSQSVFEKGLIALVSVIPIPK